MKTTLNISDPTMRLLKREAARRGQTMSELVEAALRALLQKKKPPQPSHPFQDLAGEERGSMWRIAMPFTTHERYKIKMITILFLMAISAYIYSPALSNAAAPQAANNGPASIAPPSASQEIEAAEPDEKYFPILPDHDENIILAVAPSSATLDLKFFTVDSTKWFGMNSHQRFFMTEPRKDGVFFRTYEPEAIIYIFNGSKHLLQLTLKDQHPNYLIECYWINNKLLYIKVWWGRALGTYMILDVDRESFVIKEGVSIVR